MEHFGAQRRLPVSASPRQPLAAEIADLPGESELWELGQGPCQNRLVTRAFMGRSECPSDWMIDKRSARRRDLAHNVMRRADHQRANAASLDHMRDETDGLVAERSVRNEQGEIDACFCELFGQRGCKLVFYLSMPADAAHE